MKLRHLSIAGILMFGVHEAIADTTVWLSRGEQGEAVFSDAETAGAHRIDIALSPNSSNSNYEQTSEERIQLMLDVADSLADARRARESDRAQQRARAASTQLPPATVEEEPVYYPLAYRPYRPYRPRFGKPYRHRGKQSPVDEPQARPSQSFTFKPKL